MLRVDSRGFLSPLPLHSRAGEPNCCGTAGIRQHLLRDSASRQSIVYSWKILKVSQHSVCRPARHTNCEPGLKGQFPNARAIRKA